MWLKPTTFYPLYPGLKTGAIKIMQFNYSRIHHNTAQLNFKFHLSKYCSIQNCTIKLYQNPGCNYKIEIQIIPL